MTVNDTKGFLGFLPAGDAANDEGSANEPADVPKGEAARERERVAIKAIGDAIGRATVFVVGRSYGPQPIDQGSGTLLRTRSGNVALLTAEHLFSHGAGCEDKMQIGLHLRSEQLPAFASARMRHPQADLALVLLPREVARRIPEGWPQSLELVRDLGPEDDAGWMMVLSGYPSALTREHRQGNIIHRGHGALAYRHPRGGIAARPDGRLGFTWQTAEYDDGHEELLPPPHGMSGGGLWLWDGGEATDKNQVWAPCRYLRLVGVQSAFLEGEVIVEPLGPVRSWLEEACRKLDAHADRAA